MDTHKPLELNAGLVLVLVCSTVTPVYDALDLQRCFIAIAQKYIKKVLFHHLD